jgi:hypothetical protein
MKSVLLGLALTVSLTVPASAEGVSVASGFSSLSAFGASGSGRLQTLRGNPPGGGVRDGRRFGGGFDGRNSRRIHVDDGFGGWGYYDGDYDANRSFAEDKWNDWWHDRPDRAYPRWMSRNQDCARVWYSGSELTC